jgi:hypothetical protein
MIATRERLAHHLGYLQLDLADPVMFKHVRRHARETREILERWVREAVDAGELRAAVDPPALARAIHTAVHGAMMTYPFFREGKPADWLRTDLDLVLAPWLAAGE